MDLPLPVLLPGQECGISPSQGGKILFRRTASRQGGDHRRLRVLCQREKGQETVFLRATRLDYGVERLGGRATDRDGVLCANDLTQPASEAPHCRRVALHQAEQPVAVEAKQPRQAQGDNGDRGAIAGEERHLAEGAARSERCDASPLDALLPADLHHPVTTTNSAPAMAPGATMVWPASTSISSISPTRRARISRESPAKSGTARRMLTIGSMNAHHPDRAPHAPRTGR
jgi:hypothetical protein